MKSLRLAARALIAVPVVGWIWLLWLWDSAREARRKRQLGATYEGPADNEDLP